MRWHLSGFITFLAILWPDPELMHIYCLFVCLFFPQHLLLDTGAFWDGLAVFL